VAIAFAVYGEDWGTELLISFAIVQCLIPTAEWRTLERGLKQRVRALDLFLKDIDRDAGAPANERGATRSRRQRLVSREPFEASRRWTPLAMDLQDVQTTPIASYGFGSSTRSKVTPTGTIEHGTDRD
jgi:hypothetical protein